jgi:hypothetical protein
MTDFNTSLKGMDDKKEIGRGIWWMLHKSAVLLDMQKEKGHDITNLKINLMMNIDIIKTQFPCDKCREHFISFCLKHDVSSYISSNNAFRWTYELHKAANDGLNNENSALIRLQPIAFKNIVKHTPSYEECLNYYKYGKCQEEICDISNNRTTSYNIISGFK